MRGIGTATRAARPAITGPEHPPTQATLTARAAIRIRIGKGVTARSACSTVADTHSPGAATATDRSTAVCRGTASSTTGTAIARDPAETTADPAGAAIAAASDASARCRISAAAVAAVARVTHSVAAGTTGSAEGQRAVGIAAVTTSATGKATGDRMPTGPA